MATRFESPTVPGEQWKSVVGYEGWYAVSDRGRVRRVRGGRGCTAGRILTCKVAPNRYQHVDLSRYDKKRRFLIHRLVAWAFLGPPPTPAHVVNHKDSNRVNNHVGNLEWCTVQENNRHAREFGDWTPTPMRGEENGRSILTEDQVRAIRAARGKVGQRDLAVIAGVARSLVQRIHQGRAWAHLSD